MYGGVSRVVPWGWGWVEGVGGILFARYGVGDWFTGWGDGSISGGFMAWFLGGERDWLMVGVVLV